MKKRTKRLLVTQDHIDATWAICGHDFTAECPGLKDRIIELASSTIPGDSLRELLHRLAHDSYLAGRYHLKNEILRSLDETLRET